MDPQTRKKLALLTDRIVDALDKVKGLSDSPDRSIKECQECSERLVDVERQYRSLLDEAPEDDRATVERRFGRRVLSLKQQASFLPSNDTGDAVKMVTDTASQFRGRSTVGNNAGAPPWVAKLAGPSEPGELGVGRDVDAWCGACGEIKEHSIVAMVDGAPKQVLCNTCGARHNYRTTPTRKKSKKGGAGTTTVAERKQKQQMSEKARRHEEARMALQEELANAENVRPFQTRVRYKANEIISHEEFGRGKIENVLRGRILVRFRSGLKSLSTM